MATTYLTRQILSAGTNRTKATISLWVKIGASIGSDQRFFSYENTSVANDITVFKFKGLAGASMGIEFADQTGGVDNARFDGTRALRDPASWYHFLVKADTTQVTDTDRLKIYINGELQTSTHGSYTYPVQDSTLNFGHNSNAYIDIGRWRSSNNEYFDGLITHFHYTDGTAYDASTFGSTDATTGEWKINISPSITMGTNGFTILKDGNTITDQSANSNDFTLGAGTLTKTEDNPSNNFATWNSLMNHPATPMVLLNGNTSSSMATVDRLVHAVSSIGMEAGKYYCEVKCLATTYESRIGVVNIPEDGVRNNQYVGQALNCHGYNSFNGLVYTNTVGTAHGDSFESGSDIVGIACDMDNYEVYFSKNGVWQNSSNPSTNTGGLTLGSTLPYFFAIGNGSSVQTTAFETNFGNGYFGTTAVASAGTAGSTPGIFEYDVPTGYEPLTTKGLNI
jgi:hypothetical protein